MTQPTPKKNPFDMNNTEYGDMHRIIVQSMMSGGMLDAKGVKTVFTGALKYCGYEIDEKEAIPMNFIQKTIREINEKINKYDLAIKSVTCEVTCKKYYVFIISVEKPILKMQKAYTQFEVELFQKIMDRILRKYKTFTISMVEAMNYTHEIEGHGHVTVRMAEQFIEKLINLQYFVKVYRRKKPEGDFDITLGPRSLREMEPILKDVYHDVMTDCIICKQIMLHGLVCPSCDVTLHRACYVRYMGSGNTCVGEQCNAEWTPESVMRKREREDGDDPPLEASISKSCQRLTISSDSTIKGSHDDSSETENEDGMPRLEPIQSVNINENDTSTSSDVSTESGGSSD